MIKSLLRTLLLRDRRGAATDTADSNTRLVAFARGAAIGALVGAAIAGSSLRPRHRGRGE